MFFVIGQIFIGWLLADFLSGLVHWWLDRVGNVRIPIIGTWIIYQNRLHHVDPLEYTKANIWQRSLGLWIANLIVFIIWFALAGPSFLLFSTLIGGMIVGEVHYYCHLPSKANGFIKLLWDMGIIQNPKQHNKHHKSPSETAYCGLTNMLNPILDRIRFWHWLEVGMDSIGLPPNRGN